jgi:hypothetical protein
MSNFSTLNVGACAAAGTASAHVRRSAGWILIMVVLS